MEKQKHFKMFTRQSIPSRGVNIWPPMMQKQIIIGDGPLKQMPTRKNL